MSESAVELAGAEVGELISSDLLVERLRQSAAYLQLVADELEAIDGEDAERTRSIQEKRLSMEGESDDEETMEVDAPELPAHSDISATLALGLSRLEEYHEAVLRTEESWLQIVDGTSRTARALPAPRLSRTRYPELPTGETRVDLRF